MSKGAKPFAFLELRVAVARSKAAPSLQVVGPSLEAAKEERHRQAELDAPQNCF